MNASAPSPNGSVSDEYRNRAIALASVGQYLEALALVTGRGNQTLDDELERLMVLWRMSAFDSIASQSKRRPDWPPALPDPFPGISGLPEIDAAALNQTTLAGAILHHGALLVRGLITHEEAESLRNGVDSAMEHFSAWHADPSLPPTPWFSPVSIPADSSLHFARGWVLEGGGTWAADSPRMLSKLTRLLSRVGLIDIVAEYMSERPCLSVGKTTLRRVPSSIGRADWHQDGAFLGTEVRSVNLWLALSPCGSEASGLDLMPKRIPCILETGTHGAHFDWSVGPGLVEQLAVETPVVSPEFAAGDALLFDHYFLHRTSTPPAMTKDRWAIEAWMFAPSCYPIDQMPISL